MSINIYAVRHVKQYSHRMPAFRHQHVVTLLVMATNHNAAQLRVRNSYKDDEEYDFVRHLTARPHQAVIVGELPEEFETNDILQT
jgi:hypothetical protein